MISWVTVCTSAHSIRVCPTWTSVSPLGQNEVWQVEFWKKPARASLWDQAGSSGLRGWRLDSLWNPPKQNWHPPPLESPGLCQKSLGAWGGSQTPKHRFSFPRAQRHNPATDVITVPPEQRGGSGRCRVAKCVSEKLTVPRRSPSDTLTHRYTDSPISHPHGCHRRHNSLRPVIGAPARTGARRLKPGRAGSAPEEPGTSGASRAGSSSRQVPASRLDADPARRCSGKATGSRRPSARPSPAAPCGPEAPCGSHHSPPPAGSSRPSETREGKKIFPTPGVLHASMGPTQTAGASLWGHTPRQTRGPRDGGSAAARAPGWGRPRAGRARRALRSPLATPKSRGFAGGCAGWKPAAAATFREADRVRRPAASGGPPRTGSP